MWTVISLKLKIRMVDFLTVVVTTLTTYEYCDEHVEADETLETVTDILDK